MQFESSPAREPRSSLLWSESVASAGLFVLMAVVALLVLCTVTRRADPGVAGDLNSSSTTPRVAVQADVHPPQLQPHLVIIVVGDANDAQYRSDLGAEARLRGALGELRRDAEVIGVADQAAAQALADAINDQARFPGVAPMSAVFVP